jgi:lipopolysaccharide heptosyltransferase II
MKKILIIEPNWLGDILFTTPAIRAVRKEKPDAFIACMIHPRCAELLEDNPDIDKLIIFDERVLHRGILRKLLFIRDLRRFKFDTVISFHRSMSRILIACLSGISRRIGCYTRKRSWLLTDSVEPPAAPFHRVEYFLNIIRAVGIDTDNKDYQFSIPESSVKSAESILEKTGIGADDEFFVINPGGNWLAKRWPEQRYAGLCKELKAIYGKRIFLTGAFKDRELSEEITRMSNGSAINICGKTTLKELAVIMRKAKVVVANDSGPMHIAISQKAPTIALFGPTSPEITGPYGSGGYTMLQRWHDCAIPCYAVCEDYKCMKAITVEDVIEAVGRITRK